MPKSHRAKSGGDHRHEAAIPSSAGVQGQRVAQLSHEQSEALQAAVRTQDHLRRLTDEVEQLHRIVFHDRKGADWNSARRSAEQIVMAEVALRHQVHADGVYFALRALEDRGRTWDAALRELAAALHSYYTTPLGVVMRRDLFGPDAVFILPDADEWTDQVHGVPEEGGSRP